MGTRVITITTQNGNTPTTSSIKVNTGVQMPASLVKLIKGVLNSQKDLDPSLQNYVFAYNAINTWVKNQPELDDSTKLFFSQVADVNGNVGSSPSNFYIRQITQLGRDTDPVFMAKTPQEKAQLIQATSSAIAKGLLNDLVQTNAGGGFPVLDELIKRDASSALTVG